MDPEDSVSYLGNRLYSVWSTAWGVNTPTLNPYSTTEYIQTRRRNIDSSLSVNASHLSSSSAHVSDLEYVSHTSRSIFRTLYTVR